jgi:hypothetical protein
MPRRISIVSPSGRGVRPRPELARQFLVVGRAGPDVTGIDITVAERTTGEAIDVKVKSFGLRPHNCGGYDQRWAVLVSGVPFDPTGLYLLTATAAPAAGPSDRTYLEFTVPRRVGPTGTGGRATLAGVTIEYPIYDPHLIAGGELDCFTPYGTYTGSPPATASIGGVTVNVVSNTGDQSWYAEFLDLGTNPGAGDYVLSVGGATIGVVIL